MNKKEFLKSLEADFVKANKKMEENRALLKNNTVVYSDKYYFWQGQCHYIVDKYIEISGLSLARAIDKLHKAELEDMRKEKYDSSRTN